MLNRHISVISCISAWLLIAMGRLGGPHRAPAADEHWQSQRMRPLRLQELLCYGEEIDESVNDADDADGADQTLAVSPPPATKPIARSPMQVHPFAH